MTRAAGEPGDREVLAFDLYGTLVDPIAISSELGQVLGDSDGGEAARLWRLKQLEYSFRLTAMGHYADFRWVTARALDFVLASLGASLPDEQARRLIELYDQLRPFPDAVPALQALADRGYVMAVLSNGSPAMIRNCLDNSGLGEFFGQRISADEIRVFKPSPVVYRHAAERLAVPIGRVRLVTCNAFDCVGASAAGMRTAWINRAAAPFDTIGAQPDLIAPALDRLPAALDSATTTALPAFGYPSASATTARLFISDAIGAVWAAAPATAATSALALATSAMVLPLRTIPPEISARQCPGCPSQ